MNYDVYQYVKMKKAEVGIKDVNPPDWEFSTLFNLSNITESEHGYRQDSFIVYYVYEPQKTITMGMSKKNDPLYIPYLEDDFIIPGELTKFSYNFNVELDSVKNMTRYFNDALAHQDYILYVPEHHNKISFGTVCKSSTLWKAYNILKTSEKWIEKT